MPSDLFLSLFIMYLSAIVTNEVGVLATRLPSPLFLSFSDLPVLHLEEYTRKSQVCTCTISCQNVQAGLVKMLQSIFSFKKKRGPV
jgi:hypothetical protein